MSPSDLITLPKMMARVPDALLNLPGLIKGSRMSKITDTNTPLGLGVAFENVAASNPEGIAILYQDRRFSYRDFNAWAKLGVCAVVFNHGRWEKAHGGFGFSSVRLKKHDRLYCTLPFYHATGLVVCWASVIAAQGGLVIARRFSASRFWDDIRKHNCTAFGYVGELCRYLHEQPEKPDDGDNPVHTIVGNGLRPSIWKEFKNRFGIRRVAESYTASESNVAFTNVFNFDNTVGFSPVSYAIVKYDKEADHPVRDKNGFMIKVRDIGFRHAQFVDRLGDTFRWKGENVSTTEVEQILDGFEQIVESVVYGVEIPGTNGRAGMAELRLDRPPSQAGKEEVDYQALCAYLKRELPPYAIPVFLRITGHGVETTGTFKHQKNKLKEEKYDLNQHNDPVYVLLPGESGYQRLTPETQADIDNGKHRF